MRPMKNPVPPSLKPCQNRIETMEKLQEIQSDRFEKVNNIINEQRNKLEKLNHSDQKHAY